MDGDAGWATCAVTGKLSLMEAQDLA